MQSTHATHTQGYRLTRQRRLVLDILQDSREHLDAETLYERAKARDARISLATVYRSLALLKEAGLVQEYHLGKNHGHFETIQASPHHHFTCIQCGQVSEFEAPQISEMAVRLCESQGLQVLRINLHLSGYCTNCHTSSIARS
jgi:Fur family transcriptional regulator, ferric uptake regulator